MSDPRKELKRKELTQESHLRNENWSTRAEVVLKWHHGTVSSTVKSQVSFLSRKVSVHIFWINTVLNQTINGKTAKKKKQKSIEEKLLACK